MTECAFYDGNEELLRRRKTLPRTEFDFSDRTRTIRRNANYMTEKAIPATDCHFFGSTRFFGQKVFFFRMKFAMFLRRKRSLRRNEWHFCSKMRFPRHFSATSGMCALQRDATSVRFFCDGGCMYVTCAFQRGMRFLRGFVRPHDVCLRMQKLYS